MTNIEARRREAEKKTKGETNGNESLRPVSSLATRSKSRGKPKRDQLEELKKQIA
jgi:hypothetical protein